MGNMEVLKRGDLQMTSAGTGIRHSEMAHGTSPVHFLQIWSLPSQASLTPSYYTRYALRVRIDPLLFLTFYSTRHFTDEEKKDNWVRLVAPANAPGVASDREGSGPAPVHSPLSLHASLVSPGTTLSYTLAQASTVRKVYVHVAQTSGYNSKEASGASVQISAEGADKVVLREGDGLYIVGQPGIELSVSNVGDSVAEVLLFETD